MWPLCPLLGNVWKDAVGWLTDWLVLKERFHFLIVVLCFTSGGNKQRQMQGVQVHTGTKTITMETRIQVCVRVCVWGPKHASIWQAPVKHVRLWPTGAVWRRTRREAGKVWVAEISLLLATQPPPSSSASPPGLPVQPGLARPGPAGTSLTWFEPWRVFSACSVITQSWALIIPPVGRLIRNTWPQPGGAGRSWCLRRLRHE